MLTASTEINHLPIIWANYKGGDTQNNSKLWVTCWRAQQQDIQGQARGCVSPCSDVLVLSANSWTPIAPGTNPPCSPVAKSEGPASLTCSALAQGGFSEFTVRLIHNPNKTPMAANRMHQGREVQIHSLGSLGCILVGCRCGQQV